MIIFEHPYIDDNGNSRENLIKTYSDKGLYILQNETGEVYSDAVDVFPCKYTYSETEIEIDDSYIDYKTAYNNLAQEVLSNETT